MLVLKSWVMSHVLNYRVWSTGGGRSNKTWFHLQGNFSFIEGQEAGKTIRVRHDKEGLLGKEARCYLNAIFPEISQVFVIWSFFRDFLCRTTGNGLETDELGLAGSLACRGLCCLCCAPIPWLVSFESYSFQEFLKFSGLKVVLVGLLAMAWRLMSWDLPDHLLVVGCAVCAVLPFPG